LYAVRRANAVPVSIGLHEPMVGNSAGLATYAFSMWWKRHQTSVTESCGSVSIHSVPAS
jgi:predicted secreted Zn-dependent protease